MSAEPIQSTIVNPGHDPAAIRALLPAGERADFERDYAEELDKAKRTFSLDPVNDLLEHWRMRAILAQSPHHAEMLDTARRLLAGEDVPMFEVDLKAMARGERPAVWPVTR